jgi:hypothetical protein
MQPRTFTGRVSGACLLAALLLSACGGNGNKSSNDTASKPQRLDVTARDFALKIQGSTTLRPGPVAITARNTGKQAHGLVLVKLNDGVDTPELVKTITTNPEKIGELYTYVGGTTSLPNGGDWKAITTFDAGKYAMLDVGASKKGRLNVTRHGEVQGFTVAGSPLHVKLAAPSAKLSLYDYGITLPKVIPTHGTLRVSNTGEDVHQLVFVRVTSADEARAVVTGLKTGRPARTKSPPVEALAPTSGATSTTIGYQLARGAYIAYCVQATAKSQNKSHASIGMIAAFSVN